MVELQHRRVNKTYSFRLDLLERFEEHVPRGDRSAVLERILIRELENRKE